MKLYVDTTSKQVTVTKEPTEKLEQNGRQKVERGTGRPGGQAPPAGSSTNTGIRRSVRCWYCA